MQKEYFIPTAEAGSALLPARKPFPFLRLPEARAHRKVRIALPSLPRRQSCLTKRVMIAALREAELAAKQATGGDVLHGLQAI